jgi:2',3'-cyclic-nucleotide 2'-phosphodiesterase (5'-nucleotidase family)
VPVLVLDAGNSLAGDRDPARRSEGASSIEAMNLMGYDAVTLGAGDLVLGVEALLACQAEAKFPILSANVVLSGTGDLLVSPYIIEDTGGIQVAVWGLTEFTDEDLPGLQIEDPVSVAKELVPELERNADFVVLLSHAGRPADQRIAAEVPGVDWIIGGGKHDVTWEPIVDPETGTVIVQADYGTHGYSGRSVGESHLTFDADHQLVAYEWQTAVLESEIPLDPDLLALQNRWR